MNLHIKCLPLQERWIPLTFSGEFFDSPPERLMNGAMHFLLNIGMIDDFGYD